MKLSKDFKFRSPCYWQAKECFNRAINEDSFSSYSEAFQLAEQALRQYPSEPEMHFIAGIAKLRIWGERDYALSKYRLLMGLGTKEAMEFAKKIKEEVSG